MFYISKITRYKNYIANNTTRETLLSFQKEEPVKNGKDSVKPTEAATNGNDEDGDDDLDIDDIQNTVPPHIFTSF